MSYAILATVPTSMPCCAVLGGARWSNHSGVCSLSLSSVAYFHVPSIPLLDFLWLGGYRMWWSWFLIINAFELQNFILGIARLWHVLLRVQSSGSVLVLNFRYIHNVHGLRIKASICTHESPPRTVLPCIISSFKQHYGGTNYYIIKWIPIAVPRNKRRPPNAV